MAASAAPSAAAGAATLSMRWPRPGRVIAWTLLMIGGILMITPILFMLSTSLKDASQVYDLRLVPAEPTLRNYVEVLADGRFLHWFFNSLVIATSVCLSNVFFDSMVGYALAKFRFRGRYVVFVAILSTLMIPTEMLIIPWYLMARNFHWLDSYWGIMFPGMMTAFGTFLMKQFFETVPDDFLEAARIDGLNEFAIWWKVAVPLVTPAISALAIFTFLGNWTAFIWPLIVTTNKNLYTLPVGLSSFAVEASIQWEKIMTGASLATIPTLIVFLTLQRFIVRGVVLAGLKG
jgi:multiple sugar transport system permease protein